MVKSKTQVAATVPASPSVASSSRPISKRSSSAVTTTQTEATVKSAKFQNVHFQATTGRWQAWTNCMPGTSKGGASRGPYCGAHLTENLGARAQDRALLKLKELATVAIKLNYPEADYANDDKLRVALTNKEFLELLKLEARACYKPVGPTKCFQIFLAEEKALGNLPVESERKTKHASPVTPLTDHLMSVLIVRPMEEVITLAAELGTYAAKPTSPSGEVKWNQKRVRSPRRALSPLLEIVFSETVRHRRNLLQK